MQLIKSLAAVAGLITLASADASVSTFRDSNCEVQGRPVGVKDGNSQCVNVLGSRSILVNSLNCHVSTFTLTGCQGSVSTFIQPGEDECFGGLYNSVLVDCTQSEE